MNEHQVQCFMQAATYLNFRKAADKLFITQPAMSYQIKSLEHELGVELFKRVRNHVELTAAGEYFYRSLIPVTTSLARIVAETRALGSEGGRPLVLGWAPSLVGRSDVVRLCDAFKAAHPQDGVTLVVSDRTDSLTVLARGEADIVFTLAEDARLREGFEVVPLFEARRCCVVSREHPLANNTILTWDDLRTQAILLAPRSSYPASYGALVDLAQSAIPERNLVFLEDVTEIDLNVAAGNGVAIRPVRDELVLDRSAETVAIPLLPETRQTVSLAYRKGEASTPCRRFADFSCRHGERGEAHGEGRRGRPKKEDASGEGARRADWRALRNVPRPAAP